MFMVILRRFPQPKHLENTLAINITVLMTPIFTKSRVCYGLLMKSASLVSCSSLNFGNIVRGARMGL